MGTNEVLDHQSLEGSEPMSYPKDTRSVRKSRAVGENPLRYRAELGWDVRVAHYPIPLIDGRVRCSCAAGVSCGDAGKHPRGKWKHDEGWYAPKADWLANMWETGPWNVSLMLGERSRVVVADIDAKHGGTLDTLWELGWPQKTPIEQTGGGGYHVYARYPHEGLATAHGWAKGIELLADGAQVIIAPSLHHSGQSYRWLVSPWEVAIAPLPDELVRSVKRAAEGVPIEVWPLSEAELGGAMKRAAKRVDEAVERAHNELDGGRHNTLIWLVNRLLLLELPKEDRLRCEFAYKARVEAGWAE
jgi:hypothetical protein